MKKNWRRSFSNTCHVTKEEYEYIHSVMKNPVRVVDERLLPGKRIFHNFIWVERVEDDMSDTEELIGYLFDKLIHHVNVSGTLYEMELGWYKALSRIDANKIIYPLMDRYKSCEVMNYLVYNIGIKTLFDLSEFVKN